MSKSEVSTKMNSMSTQNYINSMGGNYKDNDSGISQSTSTVYRYFNILRDYTVNRYSWQSDIINPHDLQLIEWLFFNTGRACVIYPTFYAPNNKNKGIKIKTPSVFNTNIILQNQRTSEVLKVNINDNYVNALFMPLKRDYTYKDFGMLSCNYTNFNINNVTMSITAWEYANKLYELDLTFNANATKQRIPLLFNSGIMSDTNQNYNNGNFTAGNMVREAIARNEQFVELPQNQVGEKGLLHSTNQYNENNLKEYIELQRRIMDEYLELIGIEGKQEKHGVYESKDVQERAMGNNNYKALIGLRNRRFHAEYVNKRFNLDLRVQQLEYQI